MTELRPLIITSVWQTVECDECGGSFSLNRETGLILDEDHEDGCSQIEEN